MRWGRRRSEDERPERGVREGAADPELTELVARGEAVGEPVDASADAEMQMWRALPGIIAQADEMYAAYLEELNRFREAADALELIAAERGGVPVLSVRDQVATVRTLLAGHFRSVEVRYPQVIVDLRAALDRSSGPTPEVEEHAEQMAGLLEQIEELIRMAQDGRKPLESLRTRLLELREMLGPVRQRTLASLEAAGGELAAAPSWLTGRHGLEARLAAARDRWRQLDEGLLRPSAERPVNKLHEELEGQVATLRDDIAAAGRS